VNATVLKDLVVGELGELDEEQPKLVVREKLDPAVYLYYRRFGEYLFVWLPNI